MVYVNCEVQLLVHDALCLSVVCDVCLVVVTTINKTHISSSNDCL
jgi:hypothetical protein